MGPLPANWCLLLYKNSIKLCKCFTQVLTEVIQCAPHIFSLIFIMMVLIIKLLQFVFIVHRIFFNYVQHWCIDQPEINKQCVPLAKTVSDIEQMLPQSLCIGWANELKAWGYIATATVENEVFVFNYFKDCRGRMTLLSALLK